MFNLFKSKSANQKPEVSGVQQQVSDNERSLEDDCDEIWDNLGSLSLSSQENGTNAEPPGNVSEVALFSQRDTEKTLTVVPTNIYFEVMDAKIMSPKKSKYVMYTILMRNSTFDLKPASIEKRYSDFEQLHSEMKQAYPKVMQGISFPKKLISGNFKAKTIAERSRSFEQYLGHLVMISEIRLSFPFAPFFYKEDWRLTCEKMRDHQFAHALLILRKVLDIQRKLLADVHGDTILTLCTITVCYIFAQNEFQAQLSARLAIKCIQANDKNEFLVPLLKFCIRASWTLGLEKQDLETKLAAIPHRVNEHISLEELIMRKIEMVLQNKAE